MYTCLIHYKTVLFCLLCPFSFAEGYHEIRLDAILASFPQERSCCIQSTHFYESRRNVTRMPLL